VSLIMKKGTKRPPKGEPLSMMLFCRAEASVAKQLDDIADREERSRSAVIRRLLLRALAQNEKTA
jgi:predicted transcriptional regulator